MTPAEKHLAVKLERLIDAMEGRETADGVAKIAARAVRVKEAVAAVLFLAALIAGGALTFRELQAKPTQAELRGTIKHHRQNEVHDQTAALETQTQQIKTTVERMQQVQGYLIESLAWQGDVLEHVANKRRGKPPAKPNSLKQKERELIR